MRFTRLERPERFAWTDRKLASAVGRPKRELAKMAVRYPLLADVLPQPAPVDIRAETDRRQNGFDRLTTTLRSLAARTWRESRRDFFAATPTQRDAIREAWRAWTGPTTATYFRYVVDLHTGVMEARSAAYRAREQALRQTRIDRKAIQGCLAF